MYLHIYKDCVINNNEIIGIFNLDVLNVSKINESFLNVLDKKKNIIHVNENQEKNIIITSREKITKGYITNITANTIKKRMI